jgi:hypothetical protein
MTNFTHRWLLISGIVPDPDDQGDPLLHLHAIALTCIEEDLVGKPSTGGHNFLGSFCIHPSGSSMGRQAQTNHGSGIERLAKLARIAGLDYHVIRYEEGRGMPPAILDSSAFDDPDEAATDAWRAKAKRMDESTPGWRALRHPKR